jgi:hypothetical protein
MGTLSTKKVVARKDHICDYCGLIIKKKELYGKDGIEDDGSLHTWKYHLNCDSLAFWLDMFDGYVGLTGDAFKEYVNEYYDNHMRNSNIEFFASGHFIRPKFDKIMELVLEWAEPKK